MLAVRLSVVQKVQAAAKTGKSQNSFCRLEIQLSRLVTSYQLLWKQKLVHAVTCKCQPPLADLNVPLLTDLLTGWP